ncbi:ANTAR domain-containing protein [Streptomyces qinglanensis]|uniref:ANTAR domain-containing protein n=1 Tax=Streptomyces qinglanensis TaxID=943816 RepID=A0A1H9TCP8_9ACTN|nr:ANTAR domain-containing protein [Streptomyces qinglanensis]SER95025.1 ANTAR domain-containing protein [Streptomyces qinglanensis]
MTSEGTFYTSDSPPSDESPGDFREEPRAGGREPSAAGADSGAADRAEETGAPAEVHRLREEVAQLRQALESRPVIDQARGVIMASGRCDPETAWRVLVDTSQRTNTKLREVARLLTRATHQEPLPEWLRSAVSASCARATRAARRNGVGG